MEKGGCTYIMTNKHHTTLYVGATVDIFTRTTQHKEKYYVKSFTAKYNCDKLVWYESFYSFEEALAREKQIKGWTRKKKVELIESMNPEWKDLFDYIPGS
jgi:putative endonuclease